MILREKREIRDRSPPFFLREHNFWKSLSRAPNFDYPPLHVGLYQIKHVS